MWAAGQRSRARAYRRTVGAVQKPAAPLPVTGADKTQNQLISHLFARRTINHDGKHILMEPSFGSPQVVPGPGKGPVVGRAWLLSGLSHGAPAETRESMFVLREWRLQRIDKR